MSQPVLFLKDASIFQRENLILDEVNVTYRKRRICLFDWKNRIREE